MATTQTPAEMKLHGLNPVLLVDDVTATLEYYRDKLGFTIDWKWGEPPTVAGIHRDGVSIHLSKAETPGVRNSVKAVQGKGVDIYVFVTGIYTIHDDLVRRGATPRGAPGKQPYGMIDFTLEDINGYVLSFGERA